MTAAGHPFSGSGVALVTLFNNDGSIDAPATAAHAATLVDLGVRAVVVAGSTGEASKLSQEERADLLRAVRDAVGGRAPVLAGTGAPTADGAAELSKAAVASGADALLVLSPPGTDDARPYYDTVIAAAGDVPVLAYHFPLMSQPGLAVEAMGGLSVAGLKDSSGSADRLLQTLDTWDRPVYVGSSALIHTAGALGAAGAILALANACPEDCVAAFGGDADAQLRLALPHREQSRAFPAAIKELTAKRFGTATVCR